MQEDDRLAHNISESSLYFYPTCRTLLYLPYFKIEMIDFNDLLLGIPGRIRAVSSKGKVLRIQDSHGGDTVNYFEQRARH